MDYLHVANLEKAPSTPVAPEDYATTYNFPLDPFQVHAISAIHQGHNVLVCAKTGSGKTLVGEYMIHYALAQGKRVFYTTPIKSLSNQKFYDLKTMFPGRVGIMTGDIKFCPHAQIIIMTTEILRNLLYKENTITQQLGLTSHLSLENLGAVIFDECHYINDKSRGKVWEETMILLPKQVQLIMLSATLAGPEKFASWLGTLKQTPIHLIQTNYRIVPLTHHVFHENTFLPIMDAKEVFYQKNYNDWLQARKKQTKNHQDFQARVKDARASGFEGALDNKVSLEDYSFQLNNMVSYLSLEGYLPAIAFVLSRKDCEKYARKITNNLITVQEGHDAEKIFDFHLRHHKEFLQTLPQYHELRSLITNGVAYHHSGLFPILKEIIEILYGRGLIKILFCTETFAVGLNMPTKTVLFVGLSKYDDSIESMRLLQNDEYLQMAGRAGRRGKDVQGTVLYFPDRNPPFVYEMQAMMKGSKPAIESRMTFHYDFIMKTIHNGQHDWLQILRDSYWFYQHMEAINSTQREYESVLQKVHETSLLPQDYDQMVLKDKLMNDVKILVNAQRKQAQIALNKWNDTHIGPKWAGLEKQYASWKTYHNQAQTIKTTLQSLQNYTHHVDNCLALLVQWGFLEKEDTNYKTTPLGVMATECNEGHMLLLPYIYNQGYLSNLDEESIVGLIASFSEDEDKNHISYNSLPITDHLRSCFMAMEEKKHAYICDEQAKQVISPSKFWNVQYEWVEAMIRFYKGDNLSHICNDLQVFEGNMMRTISRCNNILEELRALATFQNDVALLQKIENVAPKISCQGLAQDSLYLHL